MSILLRHCGLTVACLQQTSLAVGWSFLQDHRRRRNAQRAAQQRSKPMPVVVLGGLD